MPDIRRLRGNLSLTVRDCQLIRGALHNRIEDMGVQFGPLGSQRLDDWHRMERIIDRLDVVEIKLRERASDTRNKE